MHLAILPRLILCSGSTFLPPFSTCSILFFLLELFFAATLRSATTRVYTYAIIPTGVWWSRRRFESTSLLQVYVLRSRRQNYFLVLPSSQHSDGRMGTTCSGCCCCYIPKAAAKQDKARCAFGDLNEMCAILRQSDSSSQPDEIACRKRRIFAADARPNPINYRQ